MKIKEFRVNNFKGIESLVYAPENITAVLRGNNGIGKTSFIMAFRFAMTGDSPDDCIKDGCDHTTVSVILEDGTQFSRTKSKSRPTKVVVNGRTTTAKNLDEMLEEKSGVSKTALKITTSREVMEALKPDQFGSFIMGYTGQKLDFDTFCGYIPCLTHDGEAELSTILPAMPKKFGFEEVKNLQTYLFEERKTLKKEVESRNGYIASFTGKEPTRSLSEIQKDLERVIGLAKSQEIAKAAMKSYENSVANKERALRNIDVLKRRIDAITAKKPNTAEIDAINSKKKKCRQDIIDSEKLSQTISDNLYMLENTLLNLNKPVCPLSDKLVCTTDKTKVKSEMEELITSNKDGLEYQNRFISETKAKLDDLQNEEIAYRENEKQYNAKILLNNQYEEQKKNVPNVLAKPDEIEERDFAVEKVTLQKERDEYVAYSRYLEKVDEKEKLESRLDLIANLYTAIQPKGSVMAAITDYYISDFESVINKRSEELRTGFSFAFRFMDGVDYFVKTDAKHEMRPYEALSNGEKAMAAFLLLDMLNTLCGTRIMILDDANHLDAKSFGELVHLIQSKEMQDDYDHIFISTVSNTDFEKVLLAEKDIDFIY